MSRTITALFDSRSDAEAGLQRIKACGIDTDDVRIHDQTQDGATSHDRSSDRDTGIWASIKNAFLPDEDRHAYEEGVRRGGTVLSADVDEDKVDEAVRALEDANSVDLDERSSQWRSDGWTPQAAASAAFGGTSAMRDDDRRDDYSDSFVAGRREVERGGGKVRSYVTDTPMHEQVRLRGERASADRRPSDGVTSTASGIAATAQGLGNEAIGNLKQGVGKLIGDDDLERSGVAQERRGEQQAGRSDDN